MLPWMFLYQTYFIGVIENKMIRYFVFSLFLFLTWSAWADEECGDDSVRNGFEEFLNYSFGEEEPAYDVLVEKSYIYPGHEFYYRLKRCLDGEGVDYSEENLYRDAHKCKDNVLLPDETPSLHYRKIRKSIKVIPIKVSSISISSAETPNYCRVKVDMEEPSSSFMVLLYAMSQLPEGVRKVLIRRIVVDGKDVDFTVENSI